MNGPERRTRIAVVAAVALCAALLRLGYLAQLFATPYGSGLVVDEQAYAARAAAIRAGDWLLGSRPFYQDPLYPYFVAAVEAVLGVDPRAVKVLQALLAAGAAGLIAALACELAGAVGGALAGLAYALARPALFYEGQLEKTGLLLPLVALFLWALLRASQPGASLRAASVCGGMLGVLALLRGNFLLLAPLAALGLILATRRPRLVLLFLAGFSLSIAPATLRNRLVSGEWVLVTSQAGQNFYVGNWLGSPLGLYVPPDFLRPHPQHEEADFAREAERRTGQPMRAAEVSRYWFGQGMAELLVRPARMVTLARLRLGFALHPEDVPDNLDLAFLRQRIALLRAPLVDFRLLVALGLPGLALLVRRRPREGAAIAGFALAYLLSLLPFFVFGRYRAALLPPLALGLGAGLALSLEDLRRGRRAAVAMRGLVVLALGGLLGLLPAVPREEAASWNTLGSLHEKAGDVALAEQAWLEGLEREPEHPLLHFNLGRLRAGQGHLEQAERHYLRAIGARPQLPEPHANLGALHLDRGQLEAAEAELTAALDLDPDLGPARFNLAQLRERQQRPEEAERQFLAALRVLPPGSPLRTEALRRAARLSATRNPGSPAP